MKNIIIAVTILVILIIFSWLMAFCISAGENRLFMFFAYLVGKKTAQRLIVDLKDKFKLGEAGPAFLSRLRGR